MMALLKKIRDAACNLLRVVAPLQKRYSQHFAPWMCKSVVSFIKARAEVNIWSIVGAEIIYACKQFTNRESPPSLTTTSMKLRCCLHIDAGNSLI